MDYLILVQISGPGVHHNSFSQTGTESTDMDQHAQPAYHLPDYPVYRDVVSDCSNSGMLCPGHSLDLEASYPLLKEALSN